MGKRGHPVQLVVILPSSESILMRVKHGYMHFCRTPSAARTRKTFVVDSSQSSFTGNFLFSYHAKLVDNAPFSSKKTEKKIFVVDSSERSSTWDSLLLRIPTPESKAGGPFDTQMKNLCQECLTDHLLSCWYELQVAHRCGPCLLVDAHR